MKSMYKQNRRGSSTAAVATLLGLLGSAVSLGGKDSKLTPAELVARHLESIGPAAARQTIKSRFAEGDGRVSIVLGGTGSMTGTAQYFAEGRKLCYRLPLEYADYRGERLMFNGRAVEVGTVKDAKWSRLGKFVHQFTEIMGEGLLGGTLSTGWPLEGQGNREAKLEYQGIRKINGREQHQLQYRAKKGSSELKVHLYFEPETFRHVLTTYELLVSSPMGPSPDKSAQQLESRYLLEESFGDFRAIDGLTLPTHWTIRLNTERGRETSIWEWDMQITRMVHNQPIDPNVFELLHTSRALPFEPAQRMELAAAVQWTPSRRRAVRSA
jgi:hypothetical protein